jgi:hypothetical protein
VYDPGLVPRHLSLSTVTCGLYFFRVCSPVQTLVIPMALVYYILPVLGEGYGKYWSSDSDSGLPIPITR